MTSSSLDALRDRVAVVTGASSGIGEAIALGLARGGARVIGAARRLDRLERLQARIEGEGGRAEVCELDVSDEQSCRQFARDVIGRHGAVDVLVNDAGGARGFEPVVDGDERDWREMMEANVLGLMRLTRLFLPAMIENKRGDIVQVSSIAALQPYASGAAYCASKAAVEAFAQALRFELVGTNVRQLVIQPGLVETEFSVARFHGDAQRAQDVYRGVQALSADDVADLVLFAITRPPHVCIQSMLVTPTAQASATVVARRPDR